MSRRSFLSKSLRSRELSSTNQTSQRVRRQLSCAGVSSSVCTEGIPDAYITSEHAVGLFTHDILNPNLGFFVACFTLYALTWVDK